MGKSLKLPCALLLFCVPTNVTINYNKSVITQEEKRYLSTTEWHTERWRMCLLLRRQVRLWRLCASQLDCLQGLWLKQKRGSSLGHMGMLSPPLPMLPQNECILSLSEIKLTLRACFQDQGFFPSAFAMLSRLSQACLLRKPSGGHRTNSQSMPREVSRGIHHLTSTHQSGMSKAKESNRTEHTQYHLRWENKRKARNPR